MNQTINILIVEDEFITLDDLKSTLENIGYGVSGDAMTANEAIDILEQKNTDLAILDIHLKGSKSGIWLAHQINKKYKIPFIFLTAFSDKKTVELAADTQPSGYLVKPFSSADLFTSIEIALKNFTKKNNSYLTINSDETILNDFIFIKDNAVFKKICIADILFIEAFKNYLELHLINDKIVIRSPLKKFMENLSDIYFLQPHRSYVVNKNFIKKIEGNSISINGSKIPISRRFKERFLKKLGMGII